jgi:uncharacterized repeat protein (TIGR01451 family)
LGGGGGAGNGETTDELPGNGGFGGGGGAELSNVGSGGAFGGNGGLSAGGGGAGLGGAIFLRAGTLNLVNDVFSNDSASGGAGGGNGAPSGQGKGGALFILSGATAVQMGSLTFSGNSAANAGTTSTDNANVYGNLQIAGVADLAVTMSAPSAVAAGSNLTYSVTVTNNGPSNAANVALSDPLPANTPFVSLLAPPGWMTSSPPVGANGTVSFTNPSVAVGTYHFTIVVHFNGSLSNGTVISNTVTVGSSTFDPNTQNNSATVTTTETSVLMGPFAVYIISAQLTGTVGQTLTFVGGVTYPDPSSTILVSWSITPQGTGGTPINSVPYHPATDPGALSLTYTFTRRGLYTVSFSARDQHGVVKSITFDVFISA